MLDDAKLWGFPKQAAYYFIPFLCLQFSVSGPLFQTCQILIECMPKLEGEAILYLINGKSEALSFLSISPHILTFPLPRHIHDTHRSKSQSGLRLGFISFTLKNIKL